jgi:hypothetical protein
MDLPRSWIIEFDDGTEPASRPQAGREGTRRCRGSSTHCPGSSEQPPHQGNPLPQPQRCSGPAAEPVSGGSCSTVLLNPAHLVIGREHAHVQRHGPHHRGASTSEQPCCAVLLHDPAGSSIQVSEYSCFQLVLKCNAVLWDQPPCSRDSIHRNGSGMQLCWGKAASALTAAGHATASVSSWPAGQPPRAPDECVDHALVVAPPLDGQRGVRLRSSSRKPAKSQPPQGSRHMSQANSAATHWLSDTTVAWVFQHASAGSGSALRGNISKLSRVQTPGTPRKQVLQGIQPQSVQAAPQGAWAPACG